MHITSLPSDYGIGDFGPTAYQFVDFLSETRQGFWQILPLNPTNLAHDNSPYHSYSAFAFNPLLISPDMLAEDGLLIKDEVEPFQIKKDGVVHFDKVYAYKYKLFQKAFSRLNDWHGKDAFEQYQQENQSWLDDFALFTALRSYFKMKVWNEWPVPYRDRHPEVLGDVRKDLAEIILREKFLQFMCQRQWNKLRAYSNEKGIQIIGDVPIYVTFDSADVWTNPQYFKLNEDKKPYVVSGVPPDYFSETGQLWGNPVYNWDTLKTSGYDWWMNRIRHNMKLYDWIRIDHFRGLVAFWEVPAEETTAINGYWVNVPVYEFFDTLCQNFDCLKIIAEDLGIITDDVREVMAHYHFPGMKILQFAFGDDMSTNPYIPHRLPHNCVLYTGTHDNNTTRGWFKDEIDDGIRKRVSDYLGGEVMEDNIHWSLVRLAMQSIANLTIFPMQDILGLGTEARMNRPSTTENNWRWQMAEKWKSEEIVHKLAEWTGMYGRD